MKTILLTIFLISLAFCVWSQDLTKEVHPQLKSKVTCFIGKIDSSSSCSGTSFQPNGEIHSKGAMTCGIPGKVSEIKWSFVRQNGKKDVYKFSRQFPSDQQDNTTVFKEVQFDGNRTVIFQDEFQCIVIESPSAEDLKSAQKH